jgi:hypothetical protein
MESYPATVKNSGDINARCNITLLASERNLLTAHLTCPPHTMRIIF